MDNDIPAEADRAAGRDAKEEISNTSSNSFLTSGSSAHGEGGHVVVEAGGRQPRERGLTAEQVEEYKRLKAGGMSPELARAEVLGGEEAVEF